MSDFPPLNIPKTQIQSFNELQLVTLDPFQTSRLLFGQTRMNATRADVIAVGGAEDKENEKEILWTFFHRVGGPQATFVIIPAASGIPDVLGPLYQDIFTSMGADRDQVHILDIRTPTEAAHPRARDLIEKCQGIYFTGGDQERLAEVLAHTELMQLIRERVQSGRLVVAGTSAGASALGHEMISRGYSGESPTPAIVTVKTGLGILSNVIIDQHFHQRNRLLRLMTAVASYPNCVGIGVDENTAAIIYANDLLEVIGAGVVTIVDASDLHSTVDQVPTEQPYSLHNAKIHFLAPGSRFNLKTLHKI